MGIFDCVYCGSNRDQKRKRENKEEKKMRNKKMLVVVFMVVLAVIMLAACGGTTPKVIPPKPEGRIKYPETYRECPGCWACSVLPSEIQDLIPHDRGITIQVASKAIRFWWDSRIWSWIEIEEDLEVVLVVPHRSSRVTAYRFAGPYWGEHFLSADFPDIWWRKGSPDLSQVRIEVLCDGPDGPGTGYYLFLEGGDEWTIVVPEGRRFYDSRE